jgi:hypothetical protein
MDRQIRIRDGAKAHVLLNTEYLLRLYSTKFKSPAFHFHLFVGSTVVRWVATLRHPSAQRLGSSGKTTNLQNLWHSLNKPQLSHQGSLLPVRSVKRT